MVVGKSKDFRGNTQEDIQMEPNLQPKKERVIMRERAQYKGRLRK